MSGAIDASEHYNFIVWLHLIEVSVVLTSSILAKCATPSASRSFLLRL